MKHNKLFFLIASYTPISIVMAADGGREFSAGSATLVESPRHYAMIFDNIVHRGGEELLTLITEIVHRSARREDTREIDKRFMDVTKQLLEVREMEKEKEKMFKQSSISLRNQAFDILYDEVGEGRIPEDEEMFNQAGKLLIYSSAQESPDSDTASSRLLEELRSYNKLPEGFETFYDLYNKNSSLALDIFREGWIGLVRAGEA
jgi:hypothetical protein